MGEKALFLPYDDPALTSPMINRNIVPERPFYLCARACFKTSASPLGSFALAKETVFPALPQN
jgi:hypothetical protein